MIESHVPMSQYWSYLREAAYESGYLGMVILLARTGDAPSAYSQLRNLWTSFDNLTGQDIAFVVAGVQTDFDPRQGSLWGPSGRHYRTEAIRPISRVDSPRPLYIGGVEDAGQPFRRQPEKPKPEFSDANTREISELCQILGLTESEVPSLVLDTLDDLQPSTIPVWHSQFYKQMKEFMARSESVRIELRDINGSLRNATAALRDALASSRLAQQKFFRGQQRLQRALPTRLELVGRLLTGAELSAATQALGQELLDEAGTESPNREHCFALLRKLKVSGVRHSLIAEFNRLIDIASSPLTHLGEHIDIELAAEEALASKNELEAARREHRVWATKARDQNVKLHECFGILAPPVTKQKKTPSLPVLILAANPGTTSALDLEEELRDIQAELKAVRYRDEIELHIALATRPEDFVQKLREVKPRVILFSGHGTEDGIILRSESGHQLVAGEALARLLKGRGVDLLVLNSCYSSSQAILLADAVGTIVGTSSEVDDVAARKFSAAFFRTLGNGHSIQDAFRDGGDSVAIYGYEDVFCSMGDMERTLCG